MTGCGRLLGFAALLPAAVPGMMYRAYECQILTNMPRVDLQKTNEWGKQQLRTLHDGVPEGILHNTLLCQMGTKPQIWADQQTSCSGMMVRAKDTRQVTGAC